jgi:hypothetical protein
MAHSIDISARIDGLERALKRADALDKDVVLDTAPMAQLVGVSWVSIRKWIDTFPEFDDTDCFVRGGPGVRWEIKPKATIEKLIEHFKGEREKRTNQNRKVAQQVGLEQGDEAPADLNELSKQVSLTLTLTEAKHKQGGYVSSAKVSDFLVGYNTAAVNGVLGVKAQVDPTGVLPPDVNAAMDERLRTVAVSMSKSVELFVKEFDAGFVQNGDSRNS